MEKVSFFTLLPESIKGNKAEADKEFLLYLAIATEFADRENLIITNACGVSTFENTSLEKYFSKLKKKSTVLIISPSFVTNPKVLNCLIKKDINLRIIDGDYMMRPKLLKQLWLDEAKEAHKKYPNAVDYLVKTNVLTEGGKVIEN